MQGICDKNPTCRCESRKLFVLMEGCLCGICSVRAVAGVPVRPYAVCVCLSVMLLVQNHQVPCENCNIDLMHMSRCI